MVAKKPLNAGALMDGVRGWFERRGEIPLVPPPRLREYVPLADDPDRQGANFHAEDIGGITFALEYCDSRGWVSMRTIRCLAIDPRSPVTLKAYCNVRRTVRSFRFDRIVAIGDLRSGRVLTGEQHAWLLGPYLAEDKTDPRMRMITDLRTASRDGVFALLQLAMPDGRLGEKARAIILDYVKAEAEATQCRMPAAEAVELWVDNLSPPLETVVASITSLLANKDKVARLLPWLLKVMRSMDNYLGEETSVRELMAAVRTHYHRDLAGQAAPHRALR
jgi:hypothetical protein